MEALNQEEIKEKLVTLLKQYDEVCLNNNFTYYLAYGSLLGAVRHNGFIPWDNDVDVCMPKDEYDKFIDYCKNNDTPFILFESSINSDYYYHYAKLSDPSTIIDDFYNKEIDGLGIFIDIYPLYSLNIAKNKESIVHFITEKLHYLALYSSSKKYYPSKLFAVNLIKYPTYIFSKILKSSSWINIRNRYIEKLQIKYGTQNLYLSGDSVVSKTIFDKPQRIEFENITVNAPSNIDEYLKIMYGNYMELPKEKDQTYEHQYKAYVK